MMKMGEHTQEANVQRSAHSGVLQPVYQADPGASSRADGRQMERPEHA
jgi:hypothetical protein